jgi:cobalt-zinc-cadmium efflux system protein
MSRHHHHRHGPADEPASLGGDPHERSRASDRARRAGERRRLWGAIALTGSIFFVEIVGGLRAHYLSLVADAGHMLSDVAAQVISLAALYVASRPSDRRRTYGWYRVEILAALANGVALVALSAGIAWSAAGRLRGGAPEVHAPLAITVAAVGLVANLVGAWLLRGAESLNVRGAYLHVLQDTLSSVAVLVGGAVLAIRPDLRLIDPLLSIAIALFLCVGAISLLRDAVDVLLEAAPTGIDVAQVERSLSNEPAVREVHDLHLWTITSGIYALSAHIVVEGEGGTGQDALLGRLKRALLREFRIRHTTIQVESPGFRDGGVACERCED